MMKDVLDVRNVLRGLFKLRSWWNRCIINEETNLHILTFTIYISCTSAATTVAGHTLA